MVREEEGGEGQWEVVRGGGRGGRVGGGERRRASEISLFLF